MEGKTLVPILLLMRQTKKDDPHMNSGGTALRHVQGVGQFAVSIPPQRNTPIAEPQKEKGSCAQRQVPVIATGDGPQSRRILSHGLASVSCASAPDFDFVNITNALGAPLFAQFAGCPQDPTHCHDMGQRFILAAANDATTLTGSGSNAVVIPVRVSSVQDVQSALNNNGAITGSVTYYGHGAQQQQSDGSYLSLLAVGQGKGRDTNVSALNVADLSNTQLSNNTSIVLKTCHAGLPPISGGGHSIAQLLANQLNRGVYAWKVGFFFSHSPNATAPHGMPSETQPMYFFPEGGSSIAPCTFLPNQPEPQHCGGEKQQ